MNIDTNDEIPNGCINPDKFLKVLFCFIIICGLSIGVYYYETNKQSHKATKEELSNKQLIDAFCKENGYDYGHSFYTDIYRQSNPNYYIHGEMENVIISDITCYRTVFQKESFNNYGDWTKDKVVLYMNGSEKHD